MSAQERETEAQQAQTYDVPSLQVVAVSVGTVPCVKPQAPEEVLVVEDEGKASMFVVHLVLLCRIQDWSAASYRQKTKQKQ